MKRLLEKANSSGRSHQEALTGLRAQPLGDGLPSLSEILHGRSLVTRKASPVDLTAVHQSLIALQAKYTKSHDKAKQAKTQRALVIGEEVYFLSGKNEWQIGIVTGTTDTGRSYNILTDEGTSLRRNRSHLKPRCHDIPVISHTFPCRISTSSQSEIFSSYNNIYNNNSDCETYTSFQSEITTEYDASSQPSSREASRPSSPESGNLSVRTVYSPTPEMAVIYRTMHDTIHTVRDQQGRAVTRSLLNQQKALAASKLQCNIQIKRTSTPEHPPMSNVPPKRARARSEKANGVTSGSSEESDCEPQTSRMAQFQALKRRFETPTKSEEESPSHGTFKRQRLFQKTSSQSATDCLSNEYCTSGPS